jgi:hypothetical protein
MCKYRIKSWKQYQHYKDRTPPWIKLHQSILTSEAWILGSDATRVLMVASMLLASRSETFDGVFSGNPDYVKRVCYLNEAPDFKPLIENDFLELVHDASAPLAECLPRGEERQRRDRGETEENIGTTCVKNEQTPRFAAAQYLSGLGVDDGVIRDWLAHRKAKKAAPTETAIKGIIREAGLAGWTLEQALREMCSRGWTGFKAEWVAKNGGNGNGRKQTRFEVLQQCADELTGRDRRDAGPIPIDGTAVRVD